MSALQRFLLNRYAVLLHVYLTSDDEQQKAGISGALDELERELRRMGDVN